MRRRSKIAKFVQVTEYGKTKKSIRNHTMNIALIIAGGSGDRMGQNIPKQFMYIEGCPDNDNQPPELLAKLK